MYIFVLPEEINPIRLYGCPSLPHTRPGPLSARPPYIVTLIYVFFEQVSPLNDSLKIV